MTILVHYRSKKQLKEQIGKNLRYKETSMHGAEFKFNGSFPVANRPSINNQIPAGEGPVREFFATVTMRDGLIAKVE